MRNLSLFYIFVLNNRFKNPIQIARHYIFGRQFGSTLERICRIITLYVCLINEPPTAFAPLVIIFSWANFMILLGQLPQFSTYFEMYVSVLMQFIKLIFTYIWLIAGYVIAFYIISLDMKIRISPIIAISKTVAMMTGEYEFNDLFKNSDNNM